MICNVDFRDNFKFAIFDETFENQSNKCSMHYANELNLWYTIIIRSIELRLKPAKQRHSKGPDIF